jgi:hypothetical protein
MNPIIFLATGAHHIPSADITLFRERYVEYRIALQKVSLYKKPICGVLSEYDPSAPEVPPFHLFCTAGLQRLSPEDLASAKTKSQKEFLSIQSLLPSLTLPDETFVVKISGRYILMGDSFMNTIEAVKDNPQIQGVACLTEDKQQQYTFLFALRWKWFKQFYSKPVSYLQMKNLEQCIVEFYKEEGIFDQIVQVKTLEIFTQISNANQFQMF